MATFPIEPDMHSMIYMVWYFVSGCMLAFGATLVWVWLRVRSGDRDPMVAGLVIAVLYEAIGIFGLEYRHGDPFIAFFLILGMVLLISGYLWVRPVGTTTVTSPRKA